MATLGVAGALLAVPAAAVAVPASVQGAARGPQKVAALEVIDDVACNPTGSSTTKTKPRGYGQWSWDNGSNRYWLAGSASNGYLYNGTLLYGSSIKVTQGRTVRTYGPSFGYNTFAATPFPNVTLLQFTFKNPQGTVVRTCQGVLETYRVG